MEDEASHKQTNREEDLYGAVESAFSQGWRRMKLYFLIGLPTETDEDTLGIARMAANCVAIGKRYTSAASVTVSVGGFVPKPFTPFQWFGQNTLEELNRKVHMLKDEVPGEQKGLKLKWHDPKATLVEGILSRGDRRLGEVLRCGLPEELSKSGASILILTCGYLLWKKKI